jgi:D-alanyl-D-alanine carboxypeptidase
MTRTVWVPALVAFAMAVIAPGALAAEPKAADRALNRALERVVSVEDGPPGVIALVHRGAATKVHRAGVANVENERVWRPRDHMRPASVSKAFNGAVALSLVQRGQLELDDTIGEILPALPPAWAPVTLGQLPQHTSGLPNYTTSPGFQAALGPNLGRRFTPIELIGFVADDPLQFAPGTSYAYSNTDNIVAALMAEDVAGRSYEGLLRSQVYNRLDLNSTTLPSGSALPRPFAHGYLNGPPDRTEDVSMVASMSWVWAAGGIQSTAADLLRFIRGYVGGRLFGAAIQRAQRRWRPGESDPEGPGVNSAGMALFRYRLPCGTVYGHTGNFFGYTQFTAASADGRRAVTVSANMQLSPVEGPPAASRALRKAFERGAWQRWRAASFPRAARRAAAPARTERSRSSSARRARSGRSPPRGGSRRGPRGA